MPRTGGDFLGRPRPQRTNRLWETSMGPTLPQGAGSTQWEVSVWGSVGPGLLGPPGWDGPPCKHKEMRVRL